jgi:nucleoid-associated protein YgaU
VGGKKVIENRNVIRASLQVFQNKEGPDKLEFNFNPSKITMSGGATWEAKPSETKPPKPQFKGQKQKSMELELTFDDNEAARKKPLSVTEKIDLLFKWTEPTGKAVGKHKPHPPLLRLVWATNWFLCYIDSINATYTMFDENGTPTRATVKIGLKEMPEEFEKQNPTSGSRVGHDSHLVLEGETLPHLAHQYYEKAALWRGLATLNGIDDPSRLRAGSRISIPPIEDAVSASK